MAQELTYFSDAHVVCRHWNFVEFEQRFEVLTRLADQLENKDAQLAAVMRFHLEAARPLISGCHELHGPTGETNELYTSGRGVSVVFHQQEDPAASVTVIALISAALIAGNSVVVCSDDRALVASLNDLISLSDLPEKLVQFISVETGIALLSADIRSVGFVGTKPDERQLNLALAQRQGAITGLVSETDLAALSVAHDPYLSLRFITERTRTINITAIGGNASLLEMGHSPH